MSFIVVSVCLAVHAVRLSALGSTSGIVDNVTGQVTKRQLPFPVQPPPTALGKVPGRDYVCVPSGTCTTQAGAMSAGIDPRIVTQNGQQLVCGGGQEPCIGLAGADQCGKRYVFSPNAEYGLTVFGEYPWQAYVRNLTGYTGSGVLVNRYYVLTAAHKVYDNRLTPFNIQIYMGVHDQNEIAIGRAIARRAIQITTHENFDPSTLRNDIATVRLDAPVDLGYQINVGSACLPLPGSSYINTRCFVSGWGQTSFGANDAPTTVQKHVKVPIVSYETCRFAMGQQNILGNSVDTYLDQNELCAGGENKRDACTQDGGSPLVCEDGITGMFVVAGLVIWGKNCGLPNVYGVYVDISKYRFWIDGKISGV